MRFIISNNNLWVTFYLPFWKMMVLISDANVHKTKIQIKRMYFCSVYSAKWKRGCLCRGSVCCQVSFLTLVPACVALCICLSRSLSLSCCHFWMWSVLCAAPSRIDLPHLHLLPLSCWGGPLNERPKDPERRSLWRKDWRTEALHCNYKCYETPYEGFKNLHSTSAFETISWKKKKNRKKKL